MPPSDHVYQGDPVALQCSLLSNTEKKTCSGNHSVFWFRAGTDQSQPSLIYAHGNTGDECNKSAEDPSQYKCDYSFSKNVNTADAGSYYCAVATCGQIVFGNGTKLNVKGKMSNVYQTIQNILISAEYICQISNVTTTTKILMMGFLYFSRAQHMGLAEGQYSSLSVICCTGYKSTCYSLPHQEIKCLLPW